MAVNSIFHTNNKSSILAERNLYKDLIKEAIQIYGHDVYYVDRTLVARDTVLGEDALSKFTNANPIEMYVEDSEGFGGDKEIITQFGLENRNEITFVVSKEKFQQLDSQITLEDGTDTTGGSILLEAGSIQVSNLTTLSRYFITDESEDNILLEEGGGARVLSEESGQEFYIIQDTATTDADRPQEGDIIYHPIFEKMFESRLFWVDKLISMGAQIILCDPHRVVVSGPSPLRGALVSSPDIRAGMALLIAALGAHGTTEIMNIQQIDRGYESIDQRLNALGGKIKRVPV